MKKKLDFYFSSEGKWLRRVLLAAAFVRLFVAIFSEGYLMVDDHFLAVEPVSSWVCGENIANWCPNDYNQVDHPQPFSYAYYFLNFLILKLCALSGVINPFIQAFVLRLAHAILSLWSVYLFVKLAESLISSVTWRMFAIWFWVFGGVVTVFSVHQLVETACIPFVLLAYLYALKYFERERLVSICIAALAFSVSVGMRYQLVFFPLTLGMHLLWKRKWSGAFFFGVFFTLGFSITQIDNVLLWHKPIYQHLVDYQAYNSTHYADYPSSIFSYLSFISYYIFPFITILFFLSIHWKTRFFGGLVQNSSKGVSQGAVQVMFVFIGTAVFIGFHLIFPNRQERFLLPAVPLALVGMIRVISVRFPFDASFEDSWVNKGIRVSIYLSFVYTLSYSFHNPKSKYFEVSRFLYERGDFQNAVIDNWKGDESTWILIPMHYTGKFVQLIAVGKSKSLEELKRQIPLIPLYGYNRLPSPKPNYLIIWGKEESDSRAKVYENAGFLIKRLSPAKSEINQGFAIYSLDLLP